MFSLRSRFSVTNSLLILVALGVGGGTYYRCRGAVQIIFLSQMQHLLEGTALRLG